MAGLEIDIPDKEEVLAEMWLDQRWKEGLDYPTEYSAGVSVSATDPEKAFIRAPRNSYLSVEPDEDVAVSDIHEYIDFLKETREKTVVLDAEPVDYCRHLSFFKAADDILRRQGYSVLTVLSGEARDKSLMNALYGLESEGYEAVIQVYDRPEFGVFLDYHEDEGFSVAETEERSRDMEGQLESLEGLLEDADLLCED